MKPCGASEAGGHLRRSLLTAFGGVILVLGGVETGCSSSTGGTAGHGMDGATRDAADAASWSETGILGDTFPPAPDAPRLMSPLSTATVFSRRPTLRWTNGTSWVGGRGQVCRDRACTRVEFEEVIAEGDRFRPTMRLDPGVHFWRVYGRGRDGQESAQPSYTWQFRVGHVDGPRDTSAGSYGDFNGDGYGDLAVTGEVDRDQRVYIYRGSRDGVEPEPSQILHGSNFFGRDLAAVGDLNGDGYADLAAGGTPYGDGGSVAAMDPGRVYLYFGGQSGLRDVGAVLQGLEAGSAFGSSLSSAGDVNQDGYGDLLVGTVTWFYHDPPSPANVYLYLGSASGPRPQPNLTLEGTGSSSGVHGIADMNGDGYPEILVAPGQITSNPPVESWLLYSGVGIQRNSVSPLRVTVGNGRRSWGGLTFSGNTTPCDIDGNGLGDILITARTSMGSNILAAVSCTSPEFELVVRSWDLPQLMSDGRAIHVSCSGDANGDGRSEIILQGFAGGHRRLVGSLNDSGMFSWSTLGMPQLSMFRHNGDINGDGYSDLIRNGETVGVEILLGGRWGFSHSSYLSHPKVGRDIFGSVTAM